MLTQLRRVTDPAAALILPIAAVAWLFSLYLPGPLIISLGTGTAILCTSVLPLAWRYKYRFSWLLFRVVLLVLSTCLIIFAWNNKSAFEHNIGEPDNYDGVCGRATKVLPGPNRVVAVLREVECTGAPFGSPWRDYFIFVHSKGNGENDYRSLALSYRVSSESDNGWSTERKLKWLSGSSLLIGTGTASDIWTKRRSVNAIRITYAAEGTKITHKYRWARYPNCQGRCEYDYL
jgi:hypothetical protein